MDKYTVSKELAERMQKLGWNKETEYVWVDNNAPEDNNSGFFLRTKFRYMGLGKQVILPAPIFEEIFDLQDLFNKYGL